MEAAVKVELRLFLSKNISAESLRYGNCNCNLSGTVFLFKISSRRLVLIVLNRSNSICSSVDDIVLSYIVNVLEQIGEDQEFGVDDFAEIMAAYIPGFDTVSRYLYLTHL